MFCPNGQKSGVFSTHAVVVLILLYAFPGRQPPLTAGGGATCSEREQKTRGEDNRHVGTLSVSVHGVRRMQPKPFSLEAQTQGLSRAARGQEVP